MKLNDDIQILTDSFKQARRATSNAWAMWCVIAALAFVVVGILFLFFGSLKATATILVGAVFAEIGIVFALLGKP